MEITPVSSAARTTKVRTAKPAVPKSSEAAKKPVATKPVKAKPVEAKAVETKPKAAAAPRKRKATAMEQPPIAIDLTPMIATAAYYLAERRQFTPGYEMQDWLAAEHFIHSGMTAK